MSHESINRTTGQALGEAWRGTDPYLAHWLGVMLYLMVTGVLLLVVMDLRRLVNRWDRPAPAEQRRRQWSLVGVAAALLVVLLAMMRWS
jgi:heme/copper-type cytochrome/quinol oxidase subunit 2